jgi:hypothetical protein
MTAGRYAEKTTVASEKTRADIERLLRSNGATAFQYGWDNSEAAVMFEIASRRILFRLPMPDRAERRFTHTPTRGERRAPAAVEEAYEQAVRQRWRALLLIIKAKLEAVASGVVTLETEFLAHIVLPDGRTVGDHTLPRIADAYETGEMPALMPGR